MRHLISSTLIFGTGLLSACGGGPGESSSSNETGSSDSQVSSSSSSTPNEYTIAVTFPTANANVGGFEDSFRIKGTFTSPLNENLTELTVTVNDQTAVLNLDKNTWHADIPISQSINTINVSLNDINGGVAQQSFSLKNQPAMAGATQQFIDKDAQYSFHIIQGGLGIIRRDFSTLDEQVYVSLNDFPAEKGCKKINFMQVIDLANSAYVHCTVDEGGSAIYTLSLAGENTPTLTNTRFIGVDYSVYENNWVLKYDTEIQLTDIESHTATIPSIDIIGPDNWVSPDDQIKVDPTSGDAYINMELNGEIQLARFNIADGIANGTVTLTPLGYQAPFDIGALKPLGGVLYTKSIQGIDTVNPDSGVITTLTGPARGSGPLWGQANTVSGEILRVTATEIYYNDYLTRSIYKIDIATGDRSVHWDYRITGEIKGNPELSPTSDTLITFSQWNRYFQAIDLSNFTITHEYHFDNADLIFPTGYGMNDYDWETNEIYATSLINWGGVSSLDAIHLSALNPYTGNIRTLLTGADLQAVENSGHFRVTGVSWDPNGKEFMLAMFSAPASLNSTITEYVMGFDPQNKTFSPKREVTTPEGRGADADYLSQFSIELGVTAGTRWEQGYVQLIGSDSTVKDIAFNDTPYRTTVYPEVDAKNQRVFVGGAYPIENSTTADLNTFDIASFDIETGAHRIIASSDQGRGIDIDWPEVKYDENKDLLYAINEPYLFIIDPDSGDRAMVELSRD